MKIWLVGSGYWGSKIATKLTKLGIEHQIVDIKNGQTIDDIDTLDPVMLATPLWEHYQQARQLIIKGHDVYIEKPAAENYDHVVDLLSLVKDNIVMVGHIYMYNPILHKLKDIIDSDLLGEIQFISSVRTNLGIYQTKTTPLLSLAPHDFTIIDYLLGGDLFVKSARGFAYNPESPQADRVMVNGPNWHIDVSWAHPERKREVIVIGTKGQAVWDDDAKTLRINHNNIVNGKLVVVPEGEITDFNNSQDPLELELEHFIQCVKDRKTPTTDLKHARRLADYIDIAQLFVEFSMQ